MDENIKQKCNTQKINYTLTSAIVQGDCQIYTTTTNNVDTTHEDETITKPSLKRKLPMDSESYQQIQKRQNKDYGQCNEFDRAKYIQEPQLNEKLVVLNIKQEDKFEEQTLRTKDSFVQQSIKPLTDTATENYESNLETDFLQQPHKPNIYNNPFKRSEEINFNINPFAFPLIKAELSEDKSLQKQKQKRKRSRGRKKKGKNKYKDTEKLKQTNLEEQNPNNSESEIKNNIKFETCLPFPNEHSSHTFQVSFETKYLQLQARQRKGLHLKFLRENAEPLQQCEMVDINIPDRNEILTPEQNIKVEPTEQLQIKQLPENQNVNLKRKRLSGAQRKRLKKLSLLKSMDAEKLQENEFAKFHSLSPIQLQKPVEPFKDSDTKSSLNFLNHAANSNKTQLKVRQFEHMYNPNLFQNQEISQESSQNEFTLQKKDNSNVSSPFKYRNVESNIFIKQESNLKSCDNSTPSLISPINLQTIKSEVPELVKAGSKSCRYQVLKTCVNATTDLRKNELKWPSPPSCTSRDVQLYQQSQEKSNFPLNKNNPFKLKVAPKVFSDIRHESAEINEKTSQRNTQGRKKVSIISESPLDNDQLDKLEKSILEEILKTPRGDFIPAFCSSSKGFGCLIIVCANMESRLWLEKTVAKIQPWPGAKFKLGSGKREKRDIIRFWIPHDIISTACEILRKLEIQNSRLTTTGWKVMNSKVYENGQILVVSIDKNSSNIIGEMNNKLFLNLSKIHIKFINRR